MLYAILCYASEDHYPNAVLFNCLVFAVAGIAGQVLLKRYYTPLLQKDPRHRKLLWGLAATARLHRLPARLDAAALRRRPRAAGSSGCGSGR